jgi:hypothetical protein
MLARRRNLSPGRELAARVHRAFPDRRALESPQDGSRSTGEPHVIRHRSRPTHPRSRSSTSARAVVRRVLLGCGIVGAALYPLSDIFASTQYPGFSYLDMAVSELFAIGAPTASLVVSLFTSSSTLLLFFAE